MIFKISNKLKIVIPKNILSKILEVALVDLSPNRRPWVCDGGWCPVTKVCSKYNRKPTSLCIWCIYTSATGHRNKVAQTILTVAYMMRMSHRPLTNWTLVSSLHKFAFGRTFCALVRVVSWYLTFCSFFWTIKYYKEISS